MSIAAYIADYIVANVAGALPGDGGLPTPPIGFVYLLGADGAYLKGADGVYLYGLAP